LLETEKGGTVYEEFVRPVLKNDQPVLLKGMPTRKFNNANFKIKKQIVLYNYLG
jgi:hypothetical protein